MKLVFSVLGLLSWMVGAAGGTELTPAQSGKIAQIVGKILEQGHYKQVPLDNSISELFLKNYLDALDYNRMIFLLSDVEDFRKRYAKTLDDETVMGDSAPAFEIFKVYLQRLGEREALVQKLVQDSFDFTADERVLLARDKAPWPKDTAEAEDLWRKRIKYELLQDRLVHMNKTEKPETKTDKEANPSPTDPVKKEEDVAASAYKPEETIKTISKRYKRLLKTMSEFDSEEILQVYLTALAHAYDPHSDYMSPTEATNFEINSVKLSLSGIGALLRSEDGYAKIQSLVPGGPADLGKQLKPNDRIVAVAQGESDPVDTVDMKLNKVVEMIRGKRGTEVRLTIIPAKSPDGSIKKVIRIMRDEIKLTEQYAKGKIIEQNDAEGKATRLGVINLPQFYENCARDVEKLLDRLKKEKIHGLVLDLRRDGGGLLEEAVKLTGLFVKQNPVVQVKDNRRTTILRDEDPRVTYDGPLIVLVDRLSASASEIVAAALQDYERAIIVGDQSTHGKGTVQTLLPLNQMIRAGVVENPGKLKFTVSKFYRVAGGTTQKNGVTSDIVLPSIYDYMDFGEANLPNALPADRTKPAEYTVLNLTEPYLPELRRRSEGRVNASQDFGYVNEDIARLKKQKEDKSVSLNEAERIREKQELEAKIEARKRERANRKPLEEKVFEVTLETIDKDKPIVPMAAAKAKEDEQLASLNDPDEDPAEPEPGAAFDPELQETIRILHDYTHLLVKANGKKGSRDLVQTE